jgi:hypothetical protein
LLSHECGKRLANTVSRHTNVGALAITSSSIARVALDVILAARCCAVAPTLMNHPPRLI